MIDIKKAEQEFRKYTSKYEIDRHYISLKIEHTFRVEEICEKIAISLGLGEEKIKLAKMIGLLHDIGRFEQYTRYETFDDCKSVDHANLGLEILGKNEYIRKYIKIDIYDKIIEKAIYNHNKYNIEEKLDKEIEMYCKIIRDADKLDIMFLASKGLWDDKKEIIQKQTISPEVLEQFMKKELINKKNVKKDIDKILVNIALIFDYNFKENYKIIKQNDYINKILDRFEFEDEETKKQMRTIREIANGYIQNKIDNN